MKRTPQFAVVAGLLVLLGLAITGVYFTNGPAGSKTPTKNNKVAPTGAAALIDQDTVEEAQKLAALAVTPEEKDFASDALLISDHELGLSFVYALRRAAAHPLPPTPETSELVARIKALEPQVKAQQGEVNRLKQAVAAANAANKEAAQEELDMAQTELDLTLDELEDAHQDLIRAGGDPQAEIQRKLDEHQAAQGAKSAAAAPAAPAKQEESVTAIASFLAWRQLNQKLGLLITAENESKRRGDELATRHEQIEEQLRAEKAQHPELAKGTAAPQANVAGGAGTAAAGTKAAVPAAGAHAGPPLPKAEARALLLKWNNTQRALTAIDKRVQDFRELEEIYGNWGAFVRDRQRSFLNRLLWSAAWILLIALATMLADPLLQRLFARLAPDHKRLHTLRTLAHFVARVTGVILILLVLFGPPNQLATIIAFAGAGLTVALKDFIVSFVGWFVLMGRNGIRPGDWVEINGVGGEVLEVGLLHTVLLETGNWSDAGHPTGRKVTFVNSFAIEGHYFNFSTAGQWLWDELQVQVPGSADPYATADAIQKIAADDTRENTTLAEQDWERAVQGRMPTQAQRAFSAQPVMSIRPDAGGVNVVVRYITRVQERHALRARLYREVVELLHRRQVPEKVS